MTTVERTEAAVSGRPLSLRRLPKRTDHQDRVLTMAAARKRRRERTMEPLQDGEMV